VSEAKTMKRRLTAAALAIWISGFAPAWAGDRSVVLDTPDAPALILPPTESGKPLVPPTPPGIVPADPERCVAPLPCGTRLLGAVRKNGAVELQVPALRW
jgi:hypothetical protein